MFAYIFMLTGVFSHSWLECTKYTGDLETFQPDQCLGRPRPLAGNRNVGATFGADIGMDFRPQVGGARCQGNAQAGLAANYGSEANVVEYEAGRTYTIAWPPKNHVAATCTNANIPDTFLRLYMTPYNQAAGDPDQDTFKQGQVQASFSDDPHVRNTIDFKGFMNCPRFCDDTDKSLCTGTFTLPTTTTPQVYTFQWYWAFNSEADLYATCWEARVVPNSGTGGGDPTPTSVEVETTTTTTPQPTPPGCVDCCDGSEIVAPGTGDMVDFAFLRKDETRWLSCPEGFDGEFKIFCLLGDVRLVDGFCNPNSAARSVTESEKDQSGTIAGLAVALTFVTLAFILYVAITQGWIDLTSEGNNDGSSKWKLPQKNSDVSAKSDAQNGTRKPRANSVLTQSKTELPILPEAPAVWYYTDASTQQKGPVSKIQLMQYIRSLSPDQANKTLVWDGETCKDWTSVNAVPSIKKQLTLE